MASPFKEAKQFNGVPVDEAMLALAERTKDPTAAAALRAEAKPAHTHEVSMKFSDGTMFDIQEDETGQYIVLEPVAGGRRPRAYKGDWVCQMQSGKFQIFSNEDYVAMGAA